MGEYMSLSSFRNYLLETNFSITVRKNSVSILNYTKIGTFSSEEVNIYYEKEHIKIKGKNLLINRLMYDEVLIIGDIYNIEMGA